MDTPEVGWHPVHHTRPDPLLDGLPEPMMQFHDHGYAVQRLPEGAEGLLSSKGCAIQGWRIGRSLGLQFHCEWSADLITTQVDDPDGLHRHYRDHDRIGIKLAARIGRFFLYSSL